MYRALDETVLMDGRRVWGHIRLVTIGRQAVRLEGQRLEGGGWKPICEATVIDGRLAISAFTKDPRQGEADV